MEKESFFETFGIPAYTGNGETLPVYPCGSGNSELCVRNVSPEDLRAYLAVLSAFTRRSCSENRICGNVFQRYEIGRFSVYLSYMPEITALRMICGERFGSTPPQYPQRATVAQPSITQLRLKLGLCDCITLNDGTFLMIDGGCPDEEDEERLYRFLRDRTQTGEKPLIRAWFMTHTHPDHTRLAEDFMRKHRGDVLLAEAVYNFPDFAKIEVLRESAENNRKNAELFAGTVRECFPGAVHTVCHTGEVLRYPGVKVTTLMTHEDIYPIPIRSSNQTSSAWRFDFESGRSFMCLGDIWTEMCEQMAKTFSADYLKADIMQVTHHGLLGGHIDLYRAIDPEICLWPSPEERFAGRYRDPRREAVGEPTVQYCIGEGGCDYNAWLRDDSIKKREHFHAGKTVTIPV